MRPICNSQSGTDRTAKDKDNSSRELAQACELTNLPLQSGARTAMPARAVRSFPTHGIKALAVRRFNRHDSLFLVRKGLLEYDVIAGRFLTAFVFGWAAIGSSDDR